MKRVIGKEIQWCACGSHNRTSEVLKQSCCVIVPSLTAVLSVLLVALLWLCTLSTRLYLEREESCVSTSVVLVSVCVYVGVRTIRFAAFLFAPICNKWVQASHCFHHCHSLLMIRVPYERTGQNRVMVKSVEHLLLLWGSPAGCICSGLGLLGHLI